MHYEHPWYSQLKLLDNTMTCESPLQPKLKSAVTGQKFTEASLDLCELEEVGERETAALAALDRLYAQNADGMKRLADS